jgi:hypothetical protein
MEESAPLLPRLLAAPELLAAVARHLTHADARRLARVCRGARRAVASLLADAASGAAALHPRLFVACSAACQLLEVPLDPRSAAGPARVARLDKPGARKRRRRPAGGGGNGSSSDGGGPGPDDWPTSLAFGEGNARLFVCQHAYHGVAVLEPPAAAPALSAPAPAPAQPVRRSRRRASAAVAAGAAAPGALAQLRPLPAPRPRLLLQYPEGLALAANGWLYVVTSNGALAQLPAGPAGGPPLWSGALPDGLCPEGRRLVPWAMAAWPRPPRGAARHRPAPRAQGPAAGRSLAPGQQGQPGPPAEPACLYIAVELDYAADDYTRPPPPYAGCDGARARASSGPSAGRPVAPGACSKALACEASPAPAAAAAPRPAPAPLPGHVLRVELADDGSAAAWRRFTRADARLLRPSGLCFDDRGDLWVTTMGDGGGLVQIAGPPRGAAAGAALRRVLTRGLNPAAPRALPWDVCCLPPGTVPGAGGEALLAVSLHGREASAGAVALLRAGDGALLRLVTGGDLDAGEPNMLSLLL